MDVSKLTVYYNNFVNGKVLYEGDKIYVDSECIMTSGEEEAMEAYVKEICKNQGDILEIGFGGGVFARKIHNYNIRKHIIIECHPEIFKHAKEWSKPYSNVELINNFWQNCIDKIGKFDGIFYDANLPKELEKYGLEEFIDIIFQKVLNFGGNFTFWNCSLKLNNEISNYLVNYTDDVKCSILEKEHNINVNFLFFCTLTAF